VDAGSIVKGLRCRTFPVVQQAAHVPTEVARAVPLHPAHGPQGMPAWDELGVASFFRAGGGGAGSRRILGPGAYGATAA
jgi:hypothetical protein